MSGDKVDDTEYIVNGQPTVAPIEPCPRCPDCPVIPRCPRGYNLYDSVRAIPLTGVHHNRSAFVSMKARQKRESCSVFPLSSLRLLLM